MPETARQEAAPPPPFAERSDKEFERQADEAIDACGGNARAAVVGAIVYIGLLEQKIARLEAAAV